MKTLKSIFLAFGLVWSVLSSGSLFFLFAMVWITGNYKVTIYFNDFNEAVWEIPLIFLAFGLWVVYFVKYKAWNLGVKA